MQYDTTINDWHTSPNSGRINGSNPCFTGDTRVHTDKGLVRFDDMVRSVTDGETFEVYTHDVTNPDEPQDTIRLSRPTQFMVTGTNEVLKLRFSDGREVRCTPNHRFWTENRGWVRADELSFDDTIRSLDRRVPATMASSLVARIYLLALLRSEGHAFDRAQPPREVVRGVRSLPRVVRRRWMHLGQHGVDDLRLAGGQGRDPSEAPRRSSPRSMEASTPKPSIQENGTVQLRLSRGPFARFIEALGVKPVKAAEKEVPWSLFEAPEEVVRAFLQGLFDADGCASDGKNGTRYVGLGSKSQELLRGAQLLLTTLGIYSRVYDVTGKRDRSFEYTRKDGSAVTYRSEGRIIRPAHRGQEHRDLRRPRWLRAPP